MKTTWKWLLSHLETERSIQQICHDLISLGSVVETIPEVRDDLKEFHVVRVTGLEPHPDAKSLTVCKIDTGSSVITVVCGATNLRAGMKAILAQPGCVIPLTGKKLKSSVLRGVESAGMLCSAEELLLPAWASQDGHILDLEGSWPLGTSLTQIIAGHDHVLDIEITCNRGDLLSARGVARELALGGFGHLRPLPLLPCPYEAENRDPVQPEAKALCPSAFYLHLKGMTMHGPCPQDVTDRLASIAGSSTSSVLSTLTPLALAHYALLDQGSPMHLFDAHKIKGALCIRLSRPGEVFQGLNGITYTLAGGDVVTCDDEGIIALTGILGDVRTACTAETTAVVIESIFVKPEAVARTGQHLKLITDARTRFEYGADPLAPYPALMTLAYHLQQSNPNLELEACWGAQETFTPHHISYRSKALSQVTRKPASSERVESLLTHMGLFPQRSQEGWDLTIPSWRVHDLQAEEDIVEEILRFDGYDAIPPSPLPAATCTRDIRIDRQMTASRLLASQGFFEVMTWSFISQDQAQLFSSNPSKTFTLISPLSPQMKVLRPSLIPSLLTVASKHERHSLPLAPIFEVASQYVASENPGDDVRPPKSSRNERSRLSGEPLPENETLNETLVVAGLMPLRPPLGWRQKAPLSYLDTKGILISLIKQQGLTPQSLTTLEQAPAWYHPQRAGSLKLGHLTLGFFGEIAHSVLSPYQLKGSYAAFEAFIHRWPSRKGAQARTSSGTFSFYPISTRDIAFSVPQELASEAVLRCLEKASSSLVTNLTLFDVYNDLKEAMPSSWRKSLAFRIVLQSDTSTLTDEAITNEINNLVEAVIKNFDAHLRDPSLAQSLAKNK